MLRQVIALAIILSLPATSAAEGAVDPPRPLAAVAVEHEGRVLVTWLPADAEVDRYHVYGRTSTQRILLASIEDGTHAQVEAGFLGYQLTVVVDGIESAPTEASHTRGPCVTVNHTPPSIQVGCVGSKPDLESLLPPVR